MNFLRKKFYNPLKYKVFNKNISKFYTTKSFEEAYIMEKLQQNKDEIVTMGLRKLFELRGFKRVYVNRFEEYDL